MGNYRVSRRGGVDAVGKIIKNYKNQVHVGIDGKQWVSRVISTGTYRWKPYKV